MSATLSFLGLTAAAPELLQPPIFNLPSELSHEILDPLLLAETAELEILYPEPDTLGTVIKAWSSARSPAWAKMAQALEAEYNPIHNYDRAESWTESKNGSGQRSGTNDRTTTGTGSSSGSLVTDKAGYNSQAATNPAQRNTSTGTDQSSGTQADEWSEDTSNEETVTRRGNVSGNIGVTTSQQMIESELELRKMNLYQTIIQEFKTMFCILVY